MLEKTITPRFNDTDALGHINNATFLSWFEDARRPIFELFVPNLEITQWNLIIARVEVDFLEQTKYEEDVKIETTFEKIGNSSMTIIQHAIQNGKKVASGKCIMIHFDYSENKSRPIPEEIRTKLVPHLIQT